jgi:hypothetical protein
MFKCNRCEQYYIPGFLDCRCRVAARQLHSVSVSPPPGSSKNRVGDTLLSEAKKLVPVAALQRKSRSPEALISRG